MAGAGNRSGGRRGSGGSSVAAGRKAKSRYQMQQATKRFNKGVGKYMPTAYAPRNTRRR